ncbi:MAG: hypothetical protein ACMG6S_22625 [Byssovorax sp.]
MKRLAWLVVVAAALGCNSVTPVSFLVDSCDTLCRAKESCGEQDLTLEECNDACVADVGTPTPGCEEAITAMGECLQDNCDDAAACEPELTARSKACGGTG